MLSHRAELPRDLIIAKLDRFVASRGIGTYWGEGVSTPLGVPQTRFVQSPIQQVRAEIYEFLDVALALQERQLVLEIGLGDYGGTHFLWRMLFDRVVTIERWGHLVYALDYELDPNRDLFVIGEAHAPATLRHLRFIADQFDLVFIDGDHSYNAVAADTMIFGRLVRPGGILAWHDTCQDVMGVKPFLADYTAGRIDGVNHQVTTIDLAHTASHWGRHELSPHGVRIGLSYEIINHNQISGPDLLS